MVMIFGSLESIKGLARKSSVLRSGDSRLPNWRKEMEFKNTGETIQPCELCQAE